MNVRLPLGFYPRKYVISVTFIPGRDVSMTRERRGMSTIKSHATQTPLECYQRFPLRGIVRWAIRGRANPVCRSSPSFIAKSISDLTLDRQSSMLLLVIGDSCQPSRLGESSRPAREDSSPVWSCSFAIAGGWRKGRTSEGVVQASHWPAHGHEAEPRLGARRPDAC